MRSANGPCRRTEDADTAAPPAPASSRPRPVTGDRIAHRYGCRPEPGAAGLFGARLSHALSLSLFPSTHLGAGAVFWLRPGVRELSTQLRFPPEVARREVKRHGRLDPGGPGNGARRARREMRLALGVCPVGIQKDGLDEQQIFWPGTNSSTLRFSSPNSIAWTCGPSRVRQYTSIRVLSGAPSRTRFFSTVSHGPVGSRNSSSRLFQTLMCTASSKANASE